MTWFLLGPDVVNIPRDSQLANRLLIVELDVLQHVRPAVSSIGTGVFFAQSREKIRLHYGARFGYARTSTEFTSVSRTTTAATSTTNTTTKQTGYFVGPALGGEYFLGDRFSLGAELHVRYTSTDGRQ